MIYDYNNTRPSESDKRTQIMTKFPGSCGKNVFIETPVHMSYGKHVYWGENFYANFNLVLVDDGEIHIGDRVMIGPNVTLCTTGHPIYPLYREMVAHYSLPIHIGNKNIALFRKKRAMF